MKKKLVLFCLVLLIVFVAGSFIIPKVNDFYSCKDMGCKDSGGGCEDGYVYSTCNNVLCVGGATVICGEKV